MSHAHWLGSCICLRFHRQIFLSSFINLELFCVYKMCVCTNMCLAHIGNCDRPERTSHGKDRFFSHAARVLLPVPFYQRLNNWSQLSILAL